MKPRYARGFREKISNPPSPIRASTPSAGLTWVLLTLQLEAHSRNRPTTADKKTRKNLLYFGRDFSGSFIHLLDNKGPKTTYELQNTIHNNHSPRQCIQKAYIKK